MSFVVVGSLTPVISGKHPKAILVFTMAGNHSFISQAPVFLGPHACPILTVVTSTLLADAASRIYTGYVNVITGEKKIESTFSATYLDAMYPLLVATPGSLRLSSGTEPIEGSHRLATPIDDANRSLMGRSIEAQSSTRHFTPARCSSKDRSGKLKSSGQALWTTWVTDSRI